ncbi:Rho GTPase activation protein [Gilbertella persicaria]|uniref:Rho GTPase activation protein n=1 Tax=Gilbertella persicaria TaxID=101096 RepID=UPI00221F1FB1|nr:Rho GTPase activation protein [Gilbertella persicaria]KAI8069739.1 Rho GTPase activation protein [Gilbertella persicaria]
METLHLNRSQSTLKSTEERPSLSRMESLRRALTTSRRKEKQNTILQISLPLVESLHTTPPLSPPTVGVLPRFIPDIPQQQDAIVRHMAVLYIESYLDDLDDVLTWVDMKKSSSLWGKLKTHILTPTSDPPFSFPSSPTGEKKMGVSLGDLSNPSLCQPSMEDIKPWKTVCPSIVSCFSIHARVPGFIKDCVLTMIHQDIHTEGIFRKNGNIRALKEMCDTLDAQPHREDWKYFFKDQSIVQLAAFIKRFLRELPEPLLTYKLHKLFMLSIKAPTQTEMLIILRYTICILPKANRDTLLIILALLNWVARHASHNKMDYENLATVMAPNILYETRKQTSHVTADSPVCQGEIYVIATMIEHFETLMEVNWQQSIYGLLISVRCLLNIQAYWNILKCWTIFVRMPST